MQGSPVVPLRSNVDLDSPRDKIIESKIGDVFLRRELEACQVLKTSTSGAEIVAIYRFLNFRDPKTPLEVLSRRWPTRIDSISRHLGPIGHDLKDDVSLGSPIWDLGWSPPIAFSMKPAEVAKHSADKMLLEFSKISFPALVKRALGFHTPQVTVFLNGLAHARSDICRRFEELGQPKEPYLAVEKEIQTQCPLAFWVYSTSVRLTNDSPDPSDALSSILTPIRDVFEGELPIDRMLLCLEVFAVLHKNILNGVDLQWNSLGLADFSFLRYINDHRPWKVAELLTNDDLSCCRKLFQDGFPWPENGSLPRIFRDMGTKWSTLVVIVTKSCANTPGLIGVITETAKILLDGRNFFSGMALLEALHQANHYPAELSNYWKLLSYDRNFAHYRLCWSSGYGIPFLSPHITLLVGAGSKVRRAAVLHDLHRCLTYTGLLQCIGDKPGESGIDLTRAETESRRACTWPFSGFVPTLWLNPFAKMQQYRARMLGISDGTEPDLETGVPAPSRQALENHMKPEEEMHENPPLDPLLKEKDQDMNVLLKGTNGLSLESIVQRWIDTSEREKVLC